MRVHVVVEQVHDDWKVMGVYEDQWMAEEEWQKLNDANKRRSDYSVRMQAAELTWGEGTKRSTQRRGGRFGVKKLGG